MILKAVSLPAANSRPTEEDVRRGLEGNLCLRGAHERIVEAVLAASTGG